MRQWMCNPLMLCQKHLGGEHVESHMFIGTFKQKKRIFGYIKNNLVEPLSIPNRHNVLAWELVRRSLIKSNGEFYTPHETWIDEKEYPKLIEYLPDEIINYKIDKEKAVNDLLNRCTKCQNRALKLIEYKLDLLDTYFLPKEYNNYEGL